MTQTLTGDGRTVGAVMLIQGLLAQMIARHPERDLILSEVQHLVNEMRSQASDPFSEGTSDQFVFLTEVAEGMADTLATITATAQALVVPSAPETEDQADERKPRKKSPPKTARQPVPAGSLK